MADIKTGGEDKGEPSKDEAIDELTQIPSVDEEKAEILYENEFYSPEDIVEEGMKGLSNIYQFGFETAKQILNEARELEKEKVKEKEEEQEEQEEREKPELGTEETETKEKKEPKTEELTPEKETEKKIDTEEEIEEPEPETEEESLLRHLEFNYQGWNLGGKLIFYSTVLAMISQLLPWAGDMETYGFQDGSTLFLVFYIYPFVALTMDKPIHTYLGSLMGVFGIIAPTILYFLYPGRPLMDEMSHGFILFIAACILLIIGVNTYKRYDRHAPEKKKIMESKPCPDCDSEMEYIDNLERWYCEECDDLK